MQAGGATPLRRPLERLAFRLSPIWCFRFRQMGDPVFIDLFRRRADGGEDRLPGCRRSVRYALS
nr:MAG TPA: hypothetical protein [Caudoviricetes sp.]